jgi:hypothetical protein
MPSPIPRELRWNERFMPSPKERSSTMDSVPQAMAMTVRPMRLRLRAASTRNRRQTRSSSAGLIAQASFRATTGIEQRGPAGREIAGEEADDAQERGRGEDDEGGGLGRAHVFVELGREDGDDAERDQEPEEPPTAVRVIVSDQELAEDEARLGPHRELDPDLALCAPRPPRT